MAYFRIHIEKAAEQWSLAPRISWSKIGEINSYHTEET